MIIPERIELNPLIFFCLLCFISSFAQLKSTYSPRRIIITASSVPLRTLPGKSAGEQTTSLTGCSEGEVISYDNSGFARIRINGREGWVPISVFKTLLAEENQ